MAGDNCLWKATYTARNSEELADAYGKWAACYDKDTVTGMGYVGPMMASQLLDSYLESKHSRVLDAGCGTGLVGEALRRIGYTRLDATDYSDAMLAEADRKDLYERLFQADMNERLDVPDNTYDASICVGTFTYAHVGPQAFEELVRITKPGGFVCFTIRDGAYQEYGYRPKMLEMEMDDRWELQEMLDENYLVNEEVSAKFCNYLVR